MEKTQITEQEQFETWAKQADTPYCLLPSKYDNGSTYRTERTQHAFEGFKAGLRAAAPTPSAPKVRKPTLWMVDHEDSGYYHSEADAKQAAKDFDAEIVAFRAIATTR